MAWSRRSVMLIRLLNLAYIATTCSMVVAADITPLASITLHQGTLSVDLQDAPLAMVMTDIATRSGIDLRMENAAALPHVTAHFSGLPFAEGLARLLKNAPGSLVVTKKKGGYGGVTALHVIASQARYEPRSTATSTPATLEDIRSSITTLQAHEISPGLRQAHDDARAPAQDAMAQARSLRRTQDLDSLLKEIGSAATKKDNGR